jgi:hypothetical protein
MTEGQNLSLAELEKLYSKKTVFSTLDDTYDTLKISKTDLVKFSSSHVPDTRLESQSLLTDNYDQEDPVREAALETVSLFPRNGDQVVYRYDSPLAVMRKEILMYKGLAFFNVTLMIIFLLLNIFKDNILASVEATKSIWPNSYVISLASLNDGVYWYGPLNFFVSGSGIGILIPVIMSLVQKPKGKVFGQKALQRIRLFFILFTLVINCGNVINLLAALFEFSGSKILYNIVKSVLFITGFVFWRKVRMLIKEESKMLEDVIREEPREDRPVISSDADVDYLDSNIESDREVFE